MTDQKEAPISIPDDLVRRFMGRPGFKANCPICEANAWHRLQEPVHGMNYVVSSLYSSASYRGLEVVVMYCTQCGFVRQHAAHLVRDWGLTNG